MAISQFPFAARQIPLAVVHLIDAQNQQTWSLECDGYFGHLYPLGDRLLVASASALVCLDDQGKKVWQREHLGIDGVVVEGVEGGIVTGRGEWDLRVAGGRSDSFWQRGAHNGMKPNSPV